LNQCKLNWLAKLVDLVVSNFKIIESAVFKTLFNKLEYGDFQVATVLAKNFNTLVRLESRLGQIIMAQQLQVAYFS